MDFFYQGAICVFECLSANLALQDFFQVINFRFTQTTKHQHTRNLHSSAQLFAVTSVASHFHPYLCAMCDKVQKKIRLYSRGKWPTVSLFFTTFMANLSTALSGSCSE